jgi:enoyl-CoA hydratase/carnithine racemase
MDAARELAARIARMPVESLTATKKLMLDARIEAVRNARRREEAAFSQLIGGPVNLEAIAAFGEGRQPDFAGLRKR